MKHLIMGTAGHVDHGKTALIKALSGIDCDTHREEKERGITIHLGFAHIDLGQGNTLGIIDVPGHRDFIHTMLAGASGIDFVLLVVAADSGVMPQTQEHLRIMEILDIQKGVIAITKTDLVDEVLLECCLSDVKDLVSSTFLCSAPVVPVSTKTGQGVLELLEVIDRIAEKVENRSTDGIFRMYIDRVFSVSGFGTVVAGTVLGGRLDLQSKVYLPSIDDDELRIRRMERYGREVSEINAGDRASLNLVGLERSELRRGMVLADRRLSPTRIVDAQLTLHEPKAELGLWTQVMFHSGTYESQARIHLIDRDGLKSGETGLVQVHLSEPGVLLYMDKYVIRNSSSDTTLGGGKILDASPLHHRRRPEKLIADLGRRARGDIRELIAVEVAKALEHVAVEDLALRLNVSPSTVTQMCRNEPIEDVVLLSQGSSHYLLNERRCMEIEKNIVQACKDYRKTNPLSQRGMNLNEIKGALKKDRSMPPGEVIGQIIENLVTAKKLKEFNGTWMPVDGSDELSESSMRMVSTIETFLKQCEMQTPLMSDMRSLASRERISDADLKKVLHYLTVNGLVYRIEENYLHHTIVDASRRKLIEKLSGSEEGITVSAFRDLVGGNRKICLLLLERFDSEGLTERRGDSRFLLSARN